VIQDETVEAGRVGWTEILEYFRFATGGIWGVVLIIFLHLTINFCVMGVSLFLAYELTKKFSSDPSVSE
jgi:hypothetical protein